MMAGAVPMMPGAVTNFLKLEKCILKQLGIMVTIIKLFKVKTEF